MVNIKIKKLTPEAKIPEKAHTADAAYDLYAVNEKNKDGYIEYGTGLSFAFDPEYVGILAPRSSISKKRLMLSNSFGVLDSNFRGEVTFRFKMAASGDGKYKVGDRIGQIMFIKKEDVIFSVVEDLDETERVGGYGSSGE